MNKARLIQLLQQFDDADDIKVYAGGIEQDIERIVLFKDPTKIHLVDADEIATTPHPGETVLIMCPELPKGAA